MDSCTVLVACICCLCLCFSAAEVDWTIEKQLTAFGQDLKLVCRGSNCCDSSKTKRWYGGPNNTLLMMRHGKPSDESKYSTEIFSDRFILIIRNLAETDLNVNYECSYGFFSANKKLSRNDVFTSYGTSLTIVTEPNFKGNRTTHITRSQHEGDDTKSLVAGICVGVAAFVVLMGVVIFIYIKKRRTCRNEERPIDAGNIMERQPLKDQEGNSENIADPAINRENQTANQLEINTGDFTDSTADKVSSGYSTQGASSSSSSSDTINTGQDNGDIIRNRNNERGVQDSVESEIYDKQATFPSYKTEELRQKSFPDNFENSKEDMAKAGFFYLGHGRHAQCFCCGFKKQWSSDDNPFDTEFHLQNCQYIGELGNRTDKYDTEETCLKSV